MYSGQAAHFNLWSCSARQADAAFQPLGWRRQKAQRRDLVMELPQKQGRGVVGAATAENAMQRLDGAPVPLLAVTDKETPSGRSIKLQHAPKRFQRNGALQHH
jgi:hypothetical protein